MKNPLTTILGVLAALGQALASAPGTVGQVAHWVGIGSLAIFGAVSADAQSKS